MVGVIEGFNLSGLAAAGYTLVVSGRRGWGSETIIKLIAKNDSIKYIGYVEARDKPVLYKMAELFVYPSLYEGFGFPVLEALAAGTPVLTSHRSALPEVAGECSYLVNPNNIYDIARGMRSILMDKHDGDGRVPEKGRQKARSFNWEKSAMEMYNIFI